MAKKPRMHYPFVQKIHHRVRYGETDRMGVAYYAHYLNWMEAGRAEYMISIGFDYSAFEDDRDLFLPVVRCSVDYRSAARYNEMVQVSAQVTHVSIARLEFRYWVHSDADERLIATGHTVQVCMGGEGRIRRMHPEVIRYLTAEPVSEAEPPPDSEAESAA